MTENRKIKNATITEYDGITFKSKVEASVYKHLVSAGFKVQYEPTTFVLFNGYKPELTNYYAPDSHKVLECQTGKIRNVTYTPDFVVNDKYLIEVKGMQNDVYPVKQKFFRKLLDQTPYIFFEVHTMAQLLQAINIIKDDISRMQLAGGRADIQG